MNPWRNLIESQIHLVFVPPTLWIRAEKMICFLYSFHASCLDSCNNRGFRNVISEFKDSWFSFWVWGGMWVWTQCAWTQRTKRSDIPSSTCFLMPLILNEVPSFWIWGKIMRIFWLIFRKVIWKSDFPFRKPYINFTRSFYIFITVQCIHPGFSSEHTDLIPFI